MNNLQKAYNSGGLARYFGVPITKNPFSHDNLRVEESLQWVAGWQVQVVTIRSQRIDESIHLPGTIREVRITGTISKDPS